MNGTDHLYFLVHTLIPVWLWWFAKAPCWGGAGRAGSDVTHSGKQQAECVVGRPQQHQLIAIQHSTVHRPQPFSELFSFSKLRIAAFAAVKLDKTLFWDQSRISTARISNVIFDKTNTRALCWNAPWLSHWLLWNTPSLRYYRTGPEASNSIVNVFNYLHYKCENLTSRNPAEGQKDFIRKQSGQKQCRWLKSVSVWTLSF